MGNQPPSSKSLRRPGLILQLFAFFVLPLVALLLLIVFSSQALHQQAMRTLVGARDERAARLAAQAVDSELRRRAEAVRFLAARLADGVSPSALVGSPDSLVAGFDGGLAVFDAAAHPLAANGPIRAVDQSALQAFLKQASAEPRFSPLLTTPSAGPWVVVAAMAPSRLTVAGAFSPFSLAQATLSEAFDPQAGAAIYVVDRNRQLLYQAGFCSASTPCTQLPAVEAAFQGQSGLTYLQTSSGEHVVAFSPISSTGWAVVTEEPWESTDTTGLQITQYTPLALLVPALILAVAALWFGVRQIVQPLQALEAKAADLAWGRFDTIAQPVGGISEIRRLQAELIHLAQKVKSAQQSLRSYIGAITAGQEEERRRLARELHDGTLQALIALNQRLQLARLALTEPGSAPAAAEAQDLVDQTIADLRRFTRALRPAYLEELGLVASLEVLAREVSQAGNVLVTFNQAGAERRLAPEVELTLYRLAQEMLSNVARHAQAAHATLSLTFSDSAMTLAVSDDGRGFAVPDNPAEFAAGGHFGLLGMHERAELIGAHLEINSRIGQGTYVKVNIPA